MKRWPMVGGAVIVSLLVGWASAYMASRLELRFAQRAVAGCREAGHCDAPQWIDGLLLAWFVGPPLLFGSVALAGSRNNWSWARWFVCFFLLSLITAGFYGAWYVYAAN